MQADPAMVAAQLIVLFFGIGLHEYAHCKFADLAGDPTPRYYGRVTLNLFKHFEPVGAMLILFTTLTGFGIGWGKAAPLNAAKMRNPRWDLFIAVIAGPISNLLQALLYGSIFRIVASHGQLDQSSFVFMLLFFGVSINVALALFNLIPLGVLDGHWLVGLLLPEPLRTKYFIINRKIGFFGIILLVLLLESSHVSLLAGPVGYLAGHILGIQFR